MTTEDDVTFLGCRRIDDIMIWQQTGRALCEGDTFSLPMVSGASVLWTPSSRSVDGTN